MIWNEGDEQGGRNTLSGLSRYDGGKIFVLRPDNLGDLVLFSGVFGHLRALYPGAEITVCVKQYAANLLEHCPQIDRIVIWEDLLHLLPKRVEFRGKGRLERLLLRLHLMLMGPFDVVLLPVRSPTMAMHEVVGAVPATERLGIAGDFSNQTQEDADRARPFYSRQLALTPDRCLAPELEVSRDFLRFLGVDVEVNDLWPEFWTDDADQSWAAEHVNGAAGEIVLGIAPGVASMPGKRYPPEKLARSIAALQDVRLNVVVFGGPRELLPCNETAAFLQGVQNVHSLVNLAGRSTMRQFVEGLRRCDLVLSEETAAVHMATALGKPTVGIMGGGHFGRFYPWGDPAINRVVNRPMECYGCNWKCRYDTIRCVQEIAPEQITRELQYLIGTLQVTFSRRPAVQTF